MAASLQRIATAAPTAFVTFACAKWLVVATMSDHAIPIAVLPLRVAIPVAVKRNGISDQQ